MGIAPGAAASTGTAARPLPARPDTSIASTHAPRTGNVAVTR
jgi:hypothetical protein